MRNKLPNLFNNISPSCLSLAVFFMTGCVFTDLSPTKNKDVPAGNASLPFTNKVNDMDTSNATAETETRSLPISKNDGDDSGIDEDNDSTKGKDDESKADSESSLQKPAEVEQEKKVAELGVQCYICRDYTTSSDKCYVDDDYNVQKGGLNGRKQYFRCRDITTCNKVFDQKWRQRSIEKVTNREMCFHCSKFVTGYTRHRIHTSLEACYKNSGLLDGDQDKFYFCCDKDQCKEENKDYGTPAPYPVNTANGMASGQKMATTNQKKYGSCGRFNDQSATPLPKPHVIGSQQGTNLQCCYCKKQSSPRDQFIQGKRGFICLGDGICAARDEGTAKGCSRCGKWNLESAEQCCMCQKDFRSECHICKRVYLPTRNEIGVGTLRCGENKCTGILIPVGNVVFSDCV